MSGKKYSDNLGFFIAFALTIILGTTSALVPARAASSNEYYVSVNGNDSNPGTLEQPWRTIQKAADSMGAGDTVIVLAGEYGERVQITRSGASGSPITYRAEGKVTMGGFTIRADYIVIQGFEITDTADNWTEGKGIAANCSGCEIKDNYVYLATWGGISINGTKSIVINNRLYRNGHYGIEVDGANNIIQDNEIWGTIQHHPKMANVPSYADADGMRFFGSGHTIRGNYIHDISFDDPENVNPHIDCFQTYGENPGYDILFEGNFCEVLTTNFTQLENGHGFMMEGAKNITIRNNIIQAFRIAHIQQGKGNENFSVMKNTFMSSLNFCDLSAAPWGFYAYNEGSLVIKNNIFYNVACDPQSQYQRHIKYSTNTYDIGNNLVFFSNGVYPPGSPSPGDLWAVDPMLVDDELFGGDYHLHSTSQAIDAGAYVSGIVEDYDGNLRPQGAGYDIGVFESVNSTPNPTFEDVPFDHWAYNYIERLYQEGYIAGCSIDPLKYCPDGVMTRAESSVFVERGLHGGGYTPGEPENINFADVRSDDWYAKWVMALWEDGYTSGCEIDPLAYCPLEEHTRAEGAVFFLRMLKGVDYMPPDPEGIFADSPPEMWYTRWLEAAYSFGLIPACENGGELRICPEDFLTRAMGAYMMFHAKGLN